MILPRAGVSDPPGASGEARDHRHQLNRLDGFRHMHLKTGVEGPHAIFHTSVRRQSDGRDASAAMLIFKRAHLSDQRVTVFIRHADVTEQDVRL